MKVYNKEKTKILTEYDLEKGYLISDVLITHIPGIKGRKEEGHYETVAEYPNGGRDVQWIVDVEGIEEIKPYDEIEDIDVYIPYTEEELMKREILNKINNYKNLLTDSDYKAIKYAEGLLTEEEYKDIKKIRESYRLEINKLEEELYNIENNKI